MGGYQVGECPRISPFLKNNGPRLHYFLGMESYLDILLYVILTSIKVKTFKFHSRVVVCGSLQSKCSLPSQLCLWVFNSTLALGVLTCYVHGQCFLQIVSVHLFLTEI